MKKILTIAAAVLMIAASACKKDEPTSGSKYANTPIADYLYGVEYDDYDLEANIEFSNSNYLPSAAACTEVRKGNFVGRNLDWYINTDASAIIRMNHTEDHYASIGMVGCFSSFSNDLAKSGIKDDTYKYLPFKTTDGINEKGLYIGVNVAPTGETSFDPSTWEPYAYGHGAANTNPASDMHYVVNYLVRIVLDRAGSVDEAKKVIDSINWTEPANFPAEGYSQAFHWLICDASKSVILEFLDNKAVYTEAPSLTEPSLGNIMTNFTNAIYAKGLIQECACGLERWDIINGNYASTPETFEGFQNLMKKVWYSNTYTIDPSTHDFWFTEWYDIGIPSPKLYKNFELCESESFLKAVANMADMYNDPANWHVAGTQLWYTTHTSIYDLKNKTLRVLVHEGRDSQKEYYEASLSDSHFAKPLK